MNIKKTMVAIVASAALMAMTVVAANAQYTKVAGLSGDASAGNWVTYSPSGGSGLTIVTPGATGAINPVLGSINTAVVITFTGMTNSSYIFNPITSTGVETLTGGTFLVTNASATTTYLTGTFGPLTLTAQNGTALGLLGMVANNVTYTGGVDYSSALWSPTNGVLSGEFNTSSNIVANLSGIGAFNGTDGITFSGLPVVPEPSSVAGLGLGLLGLLGLGCLAARRRGNTLA